MIVRVVICPAAPFLVPGLADSVAACAPDLVAACSAAVSRVAAIETGALDSVLIVAAGRSGVAGASCFEPGTEIPAGGLARSDLLVTPPAILAGGGEALGCRVRADPAVVAVGTAVGARLAADAGITVPVRAVQIDAVTAADALSALLGPGRTALLGPGRTALLVIADGAACHGPDAPGAEDPRSAGFDAAIADALATGDPARLARSCHDRELAAELRADGIPALAALAAVTADRPPVRADLLYHAAPFGVGYFVADWQWD